MDGALLVVRYTNELITSFITIKSVTVNGSGIGGITAVSTVLPWNGYKFYGITAVLGSKYVGIPWGWGPGLR